MFKFALHSLLLIVLLMVRSIASAGEHDKAPKIGILFATNRSAAAPYDEAFRSGLRNLGYIDGENIAIASRYAQGDTTRYSALLHELIALKVDVLLVAPGAALTAKKATSTVPIVCPGFQVDPVTGGLVNSLSRPGGNITGTYAMGAATDAKRLQLAMDLVPNLKRMGVLFEASPDLSSDAEALRTLAKRSGVALSLYGVHNLDEILQALAAIKKERLQALLVWHTALTHLHRDRITSSAADWIPLIGEGTPWAERGAVVTYAEVDFESWRRSAVHVDKILRGAKPGDLPIDQSIAFKLVLNLRAAKALGIDVPESLRARADQIIQ